MTQGDHPLLRTTGLGVTYRGNHRALADVSFTIRAGELVAVVGPNGAGKSTMFRAIAGLIPHDGRVQICGRDCHHHRDRLGAAYIPQRSDVDLDFPITVGQLALSGRRRFVAFGRRPGASHRQAAYAALEQVGLADLAHRSIGTLSGGQLQRAFVARALAQEARLLMLDESLSGVDRAHTDELFTLFDDLTTTGASLLIATHDLDLARGRFHRGLVIDGRLAGDGTPQELFRDGPVVAAGGIALR